MLLSLLLARVALTSLDSFSLMERTHRYGGWSISAVRSGYFHKLVKLVEDARRSFKLDELEERKRAVKSLQLVSILFIW
ncbi:hypothetical protein LguiA_015122 [Lonicera macranthoides]